MFQGNVQPSAAAPAAGLFHFGSKKEKVIYFNIVRLFIIIWAALMISAVESVAIRTEGQVELESTSRDAYAKVLVLAVGSFLGDVAFKLKK